MAVRKCKNFKIYLFFKHKETAEKWLRCHGAEMEFTNSHVINIAVKIEDEAVENDRQKKT